MKNLSKNLLNIMIVIFGILFVSTSFIFGLDNMIPYLTTMVFLFLLSVDYGIWFGMDKCHRNIRVYIIAFVSIISIIMLYIDINFSIIMCVSFAVSFTGYKKYISRFVNIRPKSKIRYDLRTQHYSVGAIITNENDEILMIDRNVVPYGWACIAGHIDFGETPEDSLKKEIMEECGLELISYELIHEETAYDNTCSKGVPIHHWRIYRCNVKGNVKISEREVKGYKYVSKDEIKTLELEPIWKYWFKVINI